MYLSATVWNQIYLQCPVMEADVLHGVSPKWLWDVVGKSEVSRDQHKYSLSKEKCENFFFLSPDLELSMGSKLMFVLWWHLIFQHN
jgi:hypothetical protein